MLSDPNPYRPSALPADSRSPAASAFQASLFRTALGFPSGVWLASSLYLGSKLMLVAAIASVQLPLFEFARMFLFQYPLEAVCRTVVYFLILALLWCRKTPRQPVPWLLPLVAGAICPFACDFLRSLQVLVQSAVALPRPATATISIGTHFVVSQIILATATFLLHRWWERRRDSAG
jgi:hypothetical protein